MIVLGDVVLVSITDTHLVCFLLAGIGVPLDSQHRLFQPFSHAGSSASQDQQGTGIGLSICEVIFSHLLMLPCTEECASYHRTDSNLFFYHHIAIFRHPLQYWVT